jgi:hypothetical protein
MNSGMPRKNPLSSVRLLVLVTLLGILTFFGLPRLPEHFASPVLHLTALCCFCLAWGGSRAAVNASCEPDPEKVDSPVSASPDCFEPLLERESASFRNRDTAETSSERTEKTFPFMNGSIQTYASKERSCLHDVLSRPETFDPQQKE